MTWKKECDCNDIEDGPKHDHCWHAYQGAIWMVIPDGHVVQKCCKCPETRLVHIDHAKHSGVRRWSNTADYYINRTPRLRIY